MAASAAERTEAPVTRFFIPRFENDRDGAERVYQSLRAAAKAQVGKTASPRRIQRMECRRNGADRTVRVGEADPVEGQTVIAILQVGREKFTIHCEDAAGHGRRTTIELARRTVYDVTDFDA